MTPIVDDELKVKHLEVVVCPNGEIICLGKTLGYVSEFGKFLFEPEEKE